LKVAFQGEIGAYSEEAVLSYFGKNVNLFPQRTLAEVFEKVDRGLVDYGVVPIENSVEGSVNETHDLLLEFDLRVCGEVIHKIVHCLITSPKSSLADIKKVLSHPQALGQCRRFLRKYGFEPIPTYDTAGSVKMVKELNDYTLAAIASERAAIYYKMKVLVKGIQDSPLNYTRFLVLAKGMEASYEKGKSYKTSVIFATKHKPGALYEALGEFARRNVNLTMIVSRPTKKGAWEYNFFVDFEGHVNDKVVKDALEGLRKKVTFLKILGSYIKAESKGKI
jgi:prephenate dehydratase